MKKFITLIVLSCTSLFYCNGWTKREYQLIGAAGKGDLATIKKGIKESRNIHTWIHDAIAEAARGGQIKVVHYLLKKGASTRSCAPLTFAASGGYIPIVKLLIHHGAYVRQEDLFTFNEEPTTDAPLRGAAREGHWDVVACLLQYGANKRMLTPRQLEQLHNSVLAQEYITAELHEALNNLDFSAIETLLNIIPMEKFPQELQEQIWDF